MIQLYFLSIVCNSLCGYILFTGGEFNSTSEVQLSLQNPTFHLVLGILGAVTGVLKLLSPTMDGILLIGDLIPAAAGIVSGLILIFGNYRQNSAVTDETINRLGTNLLSFRKPLGLGFMAVALLHFLFPQALFL